MSEQINFELVSPEEKLVSEPVNMAVIPGAEGELGVMAGHASFVVALKPGVVTLTKGDGKDAQNIFIAGGFADITGENCTVLAEEAVNVDDLDKAVLEQELKNLNEDLGMAADEAAKARVRRKIALVEAKLAAQAGDIII